MCADTFTVSGIYSDGNCDPRGVNHAVTIVGYGEDVRGTPYWIVKNR